MSETKPVYYGIRDAERAINRSTSVISRWHASGEMPADAYTSSGYPLFLEATLREADSKHRRRAGHHPQTDGLAA